MSLFFAPGLTSSYFQMLSKSLVLLLAVPSLYLMLCIYNNSAVVLSSIPVSTIVTGHFPFRAITCFAASNTLMKC